MTEPNSNDHAQYEGFSWADLADYVNALKRDCERHRKDTERARVILRKARSLLND